MIGMVFLGIILVAAIVGMLYALYSIGCGIHKAGKKPHVQRAARAPRPEVQKKGVFTLKKKRVVQEIQPPDFEAAQVDEEHGRYE